MKKFLKGFGVIFFSLGIIVYTSAFFLIDSSVDPSPRPALLVLDGLFAFFIFLILRHKPKTKTKNEIEPKTVQDQLDLGETYNVIVDKTTTKIPFEEPAKMPRKKNGCDCCGVKLSTRPIQLSDGKICNLCGTICNRSPMATISNVKNAWDENNARHSIFNPNMTVTDLGCGYIFIDTENKMAAISNQKKIGDKTIVFKFSELEEFRIEKVGEKTITKTKGGIRRAVVGGAVLGPAGAIVGASTAKQETTKTGGVPILYLDLNLNSVKNTISISNPPFRATEFLNNIIDEK